MDKPCQICSREFSAVSNKTKYCPLCKPLAQRMSQTRWRERLRAEGRLTQYKKVANATAKTKRQIQMAEAAAHKAKVKEQNLKHPVLFVPRVTVSHVQDLSGSKFVKEVNAILSGRKAMARI